ncbi:hypothetical protein Celaphus_00009033 [Cervus elaphus hippelaphus]|uniref:Histone H2B n=1 Tax=Cervus elaphus hippelaphus TaxID=46360 RepID=A0A212DHR4_CEREH|nr:hypothetical protein Celaphus_00009033 [Cervus elaphus hippelaphus]
MPDPSKSAPAPKKGSKKAVTKAQKDGKKRCGHHELVREDIFERIASEPSRLVHYYNKRSTVTSREVQTAVRLLLPGELAKHAVSEGGMLETERKMEAWWNTALCARELDVVSPHRLQVVDKLFDLDEKLMLEWIRSGALQALHQPQEDSQQQPVFRTVPCVLEAAKEVHSENPDVYTHVLQLLTTVAGNCTVP